MPTNRSGVIAPTLFARAGLAGDTPTNQPYEGLHGGVWGSDDVISGAETIFETEPTGGWILWVWLVMDRDQLTKAGIGIRAL